MFKIMLCCSAGMSTSLLVSKMVDVAKERGLSVKIHNLEHRQPSSKCKKLLRG